MTQLERQKAFVSMMRSHAESAVRSNHRSRLPIVMTTDSKFISDEWDDNVVVDNDGEIERPKILTEYLSGLNGLSKTITDNEIVVLLEKYYDESHIEHPKVHVVDKFHYDDRWFSYKFSVDEPQYTFGILQVDDMPYNSIDGKRNKKSFVSSLHNLIQHEYCEPILVFIGGRFVSWDCIDVVFDCNDTYLILYGVENNWYNLTAAAMDKSEYGSISVVVLPFKVDYFGIEPSDHFDAMYEVTKTYLQSTLRLENGRMKITVPAIQQAFEYRRMVYPIGMWLYTQLKYYKMGILSEDRIKKLKKFDLVNVIKDEYGNTLRTFAMKFNAFDKDSYSKKFYDKITIGNKKVYEDNAILRFNDKGRLDDNGCNIIALFDDLTYVDSYNSSTNPITYSTYENRNSKIDNVIFRENYMIFKDGLFIPRCEPRMSIFNTIGFDNNDEVRCDIKTFYHLPIEHLVSHVDHFKPDTSYQLAKNYVYPVQSDINNLRKGYFERLLNCLNYTYSNNVFYDENYITGYSSILAYDPTILNPLHKTDVHSTVITGKEANANIIDITTYPYESRIGLKIPRHKYENHESYVLIFENGKLLKEYSEMSAYPNFFYVPVEEGRFNDNDQIELLWFSKVDNNEIEFHLTQNMINNMPELDSKWRKTTIFDKYIKSEDLKIFIKYPENILVYKDLVPRSDYIAFNISYRDGNNDLYLKREVVDRNLGVTTDDSTFTAVSSRKFIYQRLYVDQKAYRIVLDKRFKYCDNQKQYMLFINGRRIDDDAFLVTIPKYNRPFWGMYLYTAKFVKPGDQIDLFYLPIEVTDINIDESYNLDEDGYIKFKKTDLDVPFDSKLYMFFINGKKIASTNIVPVDSHTIRINKDMETVDNLIITPVYNNTIPEVKDYMNKENRYSEYDDIIRYIKSNEDLSYDELDKLLNIFISMSNTDEYKSRANVGRIAIVNEIVRDFWVTSGYEYNETPFVYDYQMDDYITIEYDQNGERHAIIPALDASQEIDIAKNEVHLIIFNHNPYSVRENATEDFFEIGSTQQSLALNWEYSRSIYFKDEEYDFISQRLNITPRGRDKIVNNLDTSARDYLYNTPFNDDMDFNLVGNRGFQIVQGNLSIKFVNGIYYGNIDEDSLQHFSWIFNLIGLEPHNHILPSFTRQSSEVPRYTVLVYKEFNRVIRDLGYIPLSASSGENTGTETVGFVNTLRALPQNANLNGSKYPVVEEYKYPSQLQHMLGNLNISYQLSPELDLKDYIIGNNNYFVYACPKRLAYKDDELLIEFIMPDPKSEDIMENCRDDKATPIYTTGNWDILDHNLLEPLEIMRMIYLGEFEYENSSGYTETYCVWRSNGFFTRLFDEYGFNIKVRYKNDAASYNDGLGHIIRYNKATEYYDHDLVTDTGVLLKDIKTSSKKAVRLKDTQPVASTINTTSAIDDASHNIIFLDSLLF